MYNRYIPQGDGTYRRSRMQEPIRQQPPKETLKKPAPCPDPPHPLSKETHKPEFSSKGHPCKQEGSIPDFLKNLLPQGLDTGDLMVILLLLLMAGDCDEDRNTAMLTLMLYLFL